MSRLFDPVALMNENIAANATKRTPLPPGETPAQITKIEFAEGKAGAQAKNPGAPWYRLDCTLEITDPQYCAQIPGQPERAVTFYGVMLDVVNGEIATGENKNVKLGKLRDAAGVNGQPLNMLIGQYIRVAIGQKPNPKEPSEIISEVVSVTKV